MFGTIMVQLDVDADANHRLRAALELAKDFDAELVAFCAADTRIHLPYEGGRAVAEAQQERREEIATRMKALQQEFLDLAGDGLGKRWIGKIGDPTQLLALYARTADLILVGTLRSGAALERDRQVDVGRLILSAGRPVLALTKDETPPRGDKVVIAWKDAREARRAVIDAIPFLTKARHVIVASVVEGGEEMTKRGCADVVRHLMHRGVRAEEKLLLTGTAPATQIAQLAREVGADLVVSGGYGHSRVREWAFGGVTRSLLHDGSLNRLFSN